MSKKYVVGSVSIFFHNFHSNISFSEHIRPCYFQITHFDWFAHFIIIIFFQSEMNIDTLLTGVDSFCFCF